MNTRITIGKCMHQGKELDCYIPQVMVGTTMQGESWHNVLSDGSYILKETYNPVVMCSKCYGKGCNECREGFRKGTPVDQRHVAELFLTFKNKKYDF